MPTFDITEQVDHWNGVWKGRIHGDSVAMNADKYRFLMKQLVIRPYLAPMEKLDIGCGSGIHATRMAVFNPYWKLKWTGIDLSSEGIAMAQRHGMNAINGDVYDFDGAGKKYQVFLFLDSLEHFFDHERLGRKVAELADKEYIIIGNIPLYASQHGEQCEREVDCPTLVKFLKAANCVNMEPSVFIYGIKGYPYMFFETANTNAGYSKWLD